MIREAAKKNSFLSGPATKRGGGDKGCATNEKKELKKNIYIYGSFRPEIVVIFFFYQNLFPLILRRKKKGVPMATKSRGGGGKSLCGFFAASLS